MDHLPDLIPEIHRRSRWQMRGVCGLCVLSVLPALSVVPVPAIAQERNVEQFSGTDPGAGADDPMPNSERAASDFDATARLLGPLSVITFEELPEGPFNSLQAAPGVTVSQTGTTSEGGIVNGCFLDCASDVRRGYNVTAGGSQYLGVALIFDVGTATVELTFETPIQAFGTYIIGLGTANGDLSVEYDDGTRQSIPIRGNARGGVQFFGFTAPGAAIDALSLALKNVRGGSRDNYSIDDVRFTPAN